MLWVHGHYKCSNYFSRRQNLTSKDRPRDERVEHRSYDYSKSGTEKVKRRYLLTFQVSIYCLLALQSTIRRIITGKISLAAGADTIFYFLPLRSGYPTTTTASTRSSFNVGTVVQLRANIGSELYFCHVLSSLYTSW